MKIAVSIPDPIFVRAERMAARLNTTRSDLYARALVAFVDGQPSHDVTAELNAIVDEVGDGVDDFTRRAARQVLERTEW